MALQLHFGRRFSFAAWFAWLAILRCRLFEIVDKPAQLLQRVKLLCQFAGRFGWPLRPALFFSSVHQIDRCNSPDSTKPSSGA
jgi:hypothetical protein